MDSLKHSDVGTTAMEMLEHRQVQASVSVEDVNEFFQKVHATRGPLAKTPLLSAMLSRCTALEAKYLVKIITGDLRIGLKEGLVEEAVAVAYAQPAEAVRQANLLLGDIGDTAKLAAGNKLGEASLVPFRPVKFMLASPEETAAGILERVKGSKDDPAALTGISPDGSDSKATGNGVAPAASKGDGGSTVVWLEDKYDGIRCQLVRGWITSGHVFSRPEGHLRDLPGVGGCGSRNNGGRDIGRRNRGDARRGDPSLRGFAKAAWAPTRRFVHARGGPDQIGSVRSALA